MLKGCLQVKASERLSCGKILKLPGLLNHLTGTLDELAALAPDEKEDLLKTIRMPRRMNELAQKLPSP